MPVSKLFLVGLVAFASWAPCQDLPAPAARATTVDGVFTSHYANGLVRERGPVDAQGIRVGEWHAYWPNGRLLAHGSYARGEPIGRWTQHDMYGRLLETAMRGPGPQSPPVRAVTVVPLRFEDLRAGLLGTTTVGELVDRYDAAGPDGESVRAEVKRLLRAAPAEASGVPFTLASQASGATRARWLDLMAVMPLPENVPTKELLAWADDHTCAAAVDAVLTAWSMRFVDQWQPVLDQGFYLARLGLRAYAARPEVLRRLSGAAANEDTGIPQFGPWLLGLYDAKVARVEPWIDALASEAETKRVEAIQILFALACDGGQVNRVPAAAVMQALGDSCAGVRVTAFALFFQVLYHDPAAFDAYLATLVVEPRTALRVVAATRFAALGRRAEAAQLLLQVARQEPRGMAYANGWSVLATVTTDPATVRDLLLEHDQLTVLLTMPGVDPRVVERIVKQVVEGGWHPPGIARELRLAVHERLADMVDASDLGATNRCKVLLALPALAPDPDLARAWVERALADPDTTIRQRGLQLVGTFGAAPTAARWRALLDDPQTSADALGQLAHCPLPFDFDPLRYPVAGQVLATWADGDRDRTLLLIDAFLGGNWPLLAALRMLSPDPRLLAERRRLGAGGRLLVEPSQLYSLFPADAVEAWIEGLGGPTMCPAPQRQWRAYIAVDDVLVAAVRRHLLDPTQTGHGTLLREIALLGANGRPLLATIEEALPVLPGPDLYWVLDAVGAIAPDQAARIAEVMLDSGRSQAVAAAIVGPRSFQAPASELRLSAGSAFVRKLLATRLAHQELEHTNLGWFAFLEDAAASLPELLAAFRQQPTHAVLQRAIASLGPAAAGARPELLAALPDSEATLRAVGVDDPATMETLESLARLGADPVAAAARRLLAHSPSTGETADDARRELLRDFQSGASTRARGVPVAHWARLWPGLDDGERATCLRVLRIWPAPQASSPLPPILADALAAGLSEGELGDGSTLRTLLRWDPLHPVAVAFVEASISFWNPRPEASAPWPQAEMLGQLLANWRRGDEDYRSRALRWLQSDPSATLRAVAWQDRAGDGRNSSDLADDRRLALDMLDLLQRLGGQQAAGWAFGWLGAPDLDVRRAALRTYVELSGDQHRHRPGFRALALSGSFESWFGPLDGLPPVCAELVHCPAVEERAALHRASWQKDPQSSLVELAADPVAARELLPELRQLLRSRASGGCSAVFSVLRRIGPDARNLLPEVEAFLRIPAVHFAARDTARVLRGEQPPDPLPLPFTMGRR